MSETYAAPQTMASDKVVDLRHETTAAESISLGQGGERDAEECSTVKQILGLLDEQKLLLVAEQDTRMIDKQLVVLREQENSSRWRGMQQNSCVLLLLKMIRSRLPQRMIQPAKSKARRSPLWTSAKWIRMQRLLRRAFLALL